MSAAPDFDSATQEQIVRANAAVVVNLLDDGTPKYGSAQGYACALTAIMQSDTPNVSGLSHTGVDRG